MKSTSTPTAEVSAPRRGRPAAQVTLVSPQVVEMSESAFESAIEAMANVIRLDWDLAGALLNLDQD